MSDDVLRALVEWEIQTIACRHHVTCVHRDMAERVARAYAKAKLEAASILANGATSTTAAANAIRALAAKIGGNDD